ncbi:hypothetical protein D9M72_580940 [compost metagenome]
MSGRLVRLRPMPPPSLPRAKSMTLSIRLAIRSTLSCISAITAFDFGACSSRARMRVPAEIEASGLRRSCPRTAMNWSRSSEVSSSRSSFSLASAISARASRCRAIRSANSRNMPTVTGPPSLAGFGSMAQSVPKNTLPRR